MAKNSDTALTGLIQIPFISSRTGPMKRLVADLEQVAIDLDRVRNAMVEAWLIWRRTTAWQPEVRLDKEGKPYPPSKNDMHPMYIADDGTVGEFLPAEVPGKTKRAKAGKKSEEPLVEYRRADGVKGKGFQTWLYDRGRELAPHVSSRLISMAAAEVLSNLKTDVQHQHDGRYRFRWQAMLSYEEGCKLGFHARTIPVPNNDSCFCYVGRATSKSKEAEKWGASGAVLEFPLFSKASSREITCPIVTLNVGSQSPGNRKVLAKIASKEWKFSDSKIVRKEVRKGNKFVMQWQIQLTYKQPSQSLGLNKNRVAVIWPHFKESKQPFSIECEDGSARPWFCGHGGWIAREYENLEVRRKTLRGRYKVSSSGMKGHGRNRFEMRLKPWARKTHNIQRHFTWQLINEFVKFCKANDCGKVIYREPWTGIRPKLWLAQQHVAVPYDWTSLVTDLKHKLRFYGIEVEVQSVNGVEIRKKFGGKDEDDGKLSRAVS